MKPTTFRLILPALLLAPTSAWALDCDAIMNMVTVNVPIPTIVSSIQGSSPKPTAADVACLRSRNAPAEVIAAAETAGGGAPAPAPAPTPVAPAPVAPPPMAAVGDDAELIGADTDTEEMDSGGGPPLLEELIAAYRAKKFLTSSAGLHQLLVDKTFPDQEAKIQYYLAKSLYDMNLFHGAQHYFFEVVRAGPTNPYFKYALPRLVTIAELTGNDTELLRVVDKIPPEAFPRQARNHLYYLMGRKLYEDGELNAASQFFQQISNKSELYMRARYLDGIIAAERGKQKSAVLAFREVMQTQPPVTDPRRAAEIEDLKDLALINIARTYYSLERFDNADEYYAQVRRDSAFWSDAIFERAWSKFLLNDVNKTLGLLLTVKSPYFVATDFKPEAQVLRALTFFNLCEYDLVETELNEFNTHYAPMAAEMKALLDQYKSQESRQLADQVYDSYFVTPKADTTLDRAMFAKFLRNRDMSSIVRHMDMMDTELATVDAQKAAWKDTIGAELRRIYNEDRVRYKRRAGLLVLREMSREYQHLSDLLLQGKTIQFEVVDAQRADYEFRSGNPDVEALNEAPADYAVDPYTIYWPFNGEFWKDELGYYEYTERGSCK